MAIDFSVSDEGIALITLNRPERLNAMDAEHYQALSKAWIRVRDDPSIRVAIVTGAGDKSFTTGADIKSFITAPTPMAKMWETQADQLLNRGLEVWKPVISAVNGYCLGGGITLMLATDIRIAATHATFNLAEVKRGMIAGNGGTQRILSQVPYAIAMEILLTGDTFDATTAERWGLVNRVVPMEQLMPTALDFARRIAANAPLAVQAAKELAIRSRDLDLQSGLRLERMIGRMLQDTEDVAEGSRAFAEKRDPRFKGQ
ncbi:MAG: enoyl-CoA hydratase/isomerase family protein [Betaproteobacteria bacterium]|nr:enoyl-CoA hydratase/isomerase family protein [Betaproteobacteria bacterium]